jgi:hypothetical protein
MCPSAIQRVRSINYEKQNQPSNMHPKQSTLSKNDKQSSHDKQN